MANSDAAVSVNRFRLTPRTWLVLGLIALLLIGAVVTLVLLLGGDEEPVADDRPPALLLNDLPVPPERFGFELNDQRQGYYEYHATDLASEDPFNVLSFYQSEMGERGWVAVEQDGTDGGVATLRYEKEGTLVRIDILADPPGSHDFSVRFTVCPPNPKKQC